MNKLGARRLEEAVELGHGLVAGLSGAGALIVDSQLRILAAEGEAFESLSLDGILGRRVRDVIPAAAWAVFRPRYEAALAGSAQAFDYAVSTPTAHRIRMAPIHEDEEVLGILVLAEDAPRSATRPGGSRAAFASGSRCSTFWTRGSS